MLPAGCPAWVLTETDGQLADVVRGMRDFHRFIFKNAHNRILDHGDLKLWHGRIFQSVVPKAYYAGNFRSVDPDKPCLAYPVFVGTNPGAPFAQVPDLMKEYSSQLAVYTAETDEYVHSAVTEVEKARAVLQLVAFAVGRFIQIHPFTNGNGRMSRLLANYFLHRYDKPLLFSEAAYPRPLDPSYAASSEACMRGDFSLMFRYVLKAIAPSN